MMSELTIWQAVFLIMVVSTVWTVILMWKFSQMYAERFQSLTTIFVAAMAERDAAFQKFRAQAARDYIMDASTFDQSLEDVSDVMPPSAVNLPEGPDDERKTGD